MIEAIAGIDEAGRGPLIGDMFLACIVIDKGSLRRLMEAGVRDSKTLSRSRRMKLLPIIINYSIRIFVRRYPPHVIDERNINELLARGVAEILRRLNSLNNVNVDAVYIDDIGGRKAHEIIFSALPQGELPRIVIEPKADRKYVVVSAASVLAKCLRDLHVEGLHRLWGDFGSGYPSDPKLRTWLKSVLEKGSIPPIIRRSWKTYRKALASSKSLLKWVAKAKV